MNDRRYLNIPDLETNAAKALGALFDPKRKRWYVPPEANLLASSRWIVESPPPPRTPAASASMLPRLLDHTDGPVQSVQVTPDGSSITAGRPSGLALSALLRVVHAAVAQAFERGVWTVVEVLRVSWTHGHVYLELTERDQRGQLLAKANAVIWSAAAANILPAFEASTGAKIAAGIKLLVRAKPVFKAQFGFALEIDAVDALYTLGDLEAQKEAIRVRLRLDGVLSRNQALAAPWDFRKVLVVAPQDAAGLSLRENT